LKVKDANLVFTGDTVFSDDLGRTDLEGGSEAMLKKSIMNKVATWPDDVMIYPGHGESALMAEVRRKRISYLDKK